MSSDEPGWTENPAELLKYRVMAVMERGESDCVEIAHALTCGPDEVRDVFEWLVAADMAGHTPLRGGDTQPHDAFLNAHGKARVREWQAARTPGRTKRACEAALLAWLDARDGETIPSTNDLLKDVRGYYFGEPFSDDTIGQAAKEVLDHGLIRGHRTSVPGVLRPAITPLGRAVLTQHGGDLGAWLATSSGQRGDTFHISNSTGVTVANRSPGAQQSVHVTTDAREQILNVASALEQMTPALGLGPADVARAAGLVGQLREAAEVVEEEPERARGLLNTVKAIAVNGTGSAAGTALVALVEAVAHSL